MWMIPSTHLKQGDASALRRQQHQRAEDAAAKCTQQARL